MEKKDQYTLPDSELVKEKLANFNRLQYSVGDATIK